MGSDMHYREDDLLRRKGAALSGKTHVVVVLIGVHVEVYGPMTEYEANKDVKVRRDEYGNGMDGGNPKRFYARQMRGPLLALIEDNQP